MKKKVLLMAAMALQVWGASAFEGKAEIDGINYYIITKGAVAEVVFKSTGYKGDIVIPLTVEYDGVTCTVTSIGNGAFYYETGLTSVAIPNTVTKIGTTAFRGCSKLKSVNVPSSIESIGDQAFLGCEGLETVTADDIAAWCGMEIGNDANPLPYAQHFVVNGEEVADLEIPSTVTTINSRAFHGYKGLRTVTLSSNITSIGDYAFFECTGLTTVNLPSSVTDIGNEAFYGCSALTSITIPNGLTTIKNRCFSGCSSLTSLSVPSSVITIETYAFRGCKSLKTIYLGSGLKTLGLLSFGECSELADVYCWAENPPVVQGFYKDYSLPFYGSHVEYAKLHVPESSISLYQGNAVWKGFGQIMALTTDDTGISVHDNENVTVRSYYTLDGKSSINPIRGRINIIRMNDGSMKKVILR